ncbi:MAG: AAA family ATPase [Opitutaceae bacterium]
MTQPAAPALSEADVALLREVRDLYPVIAREVGKRIVGQENLIRDLVVGLFAQGHCLMIGAPGLAKTLMIRTLAECLALDFRRIQFTPDLMPGDILGSEILEETDEGKRAFRFVPGPIFGQLILADEINRTPPKTQAALLEAMQERRVTIAGATHALKAPFFVLATQNPIEQEGTYTLPEAQLDRFMFCLHVGYPSRDEEVQVLLRTTGATETAPSVVLHGEKILALQRTIRAIAVPLSVAEYSVDLVRRTRPASADATDSVKRYVRWGAGPRASQYLALAGKVHAALDGRFNVAREDIAAAAQLVLRHRLILNYRAEADAVTADKIVAEIVARK